MNSYFFQKGLMSVLEPDSDFDFAQLWNNIKANKLALVTIPLVTGVLVLLWTMLKKPVWEASVTVEVGHIMQSPIEPMDSYVGRAFDQAFGERVIEKMKLPVDERAAAEKRYASSIRIISSLSPAKTVVMKVKGDSKESARRSLEATIDLINELHAPAMEKTVSNLQQNLKDIESSIKDLEKQMSLIENVVKQPNAKSEVAASLVYMIGIYIMSQDLKNLNQAKKSVLEKLDPDNTHLSKPAEEIWVSDYPIASNKPKNFIFGLLGGAFIALIYIVLRNSFKKKRIP